MGRKNSSRLVNYLAGMTIATITTAGLLYSSCEPFRESVYKNILYPLFEAPPRYHNGLEVDSAAREEIKDFLVEGEPLPRYNEKAENASE